MRKIINFDPPHKKKETIHMCSICHAPFIWNKNCWWFGAIENVEYKFCSERCRDEGAEKFSIITVTDDKSD